MRHMMNKQMQAKMEQADQAEEKKPKKTKGPVRHVRIERAQGGHIVHVERDEPTPGSQARVFTDKAKMMQHVSDELGD